MDIWLTEQEILELQQQLNPTAAAAATVDANWHKLKLERAQPQRQYRTTTTSKTQTPILLDFDTHYSFTYRSSDGASWNTELRNISPGVRLLTPEQARLKDSLDTMIALCNLNIRTRWHTPINRFKQCDPRYQLIHTGTEWWCVIDLEIYAESTRRTRTDRGYTEITFSTKQKPLLTQDIIDSQIDKYFGLG